MFIFAFLNMLYAYLIQLSKPYRDILTVRFTELTQQYSGPDITRTYLASGFYG
jgi:hypothetical protein